MRPATKMRLDLSPPTRQGCRVINELDRVALTTGLLKYGLVKDDVGTVVFVYAGGKGFEVEFFSLMGETVAVATVDAAQVRPLTKREVTHARKLEAAPA